MSSAVNVFISYSHEDKAWLTRVQQHLKPVVRGERVVCWADTELRAGDEWRPEIEEALRTAHAAILLLSPAFYASDFIIEEELPKLLDKAGNGAARLFIVVLRTCRFRRDGQLNRFQTVHDPNKPLNMLDEAGQDKVLDRLAEEVERLLVQPVRPPEPTLRSVANPYAPYRVVLPPLFVGRVKELRKLALCLDRRQSLSLVGDWRMGKSSLLNTWVQQARLQGRMVVMLNGQSAEGASAPALVAHITGRACVGDADAWATQLDDWVRMQGSLAPVLVLDEADKLVQQEHRFWERMRGMQDRCTWVLATRSEISEISIGSPFANQIDLIRLGLLDDDSAQNVAELGNFPHRLVALMLEWAGNHPFYLQLLGYHLHDAGGDEFEGLDDFLKISKMRLCEWWSCLDEGEKEAMINWRQGAAKQKRSLRWRGIVDGEGRPFGRVLIDWLESFK